MLNIHQLFSIARVNPRNPMNQPGRLMGRHCVARLQRAQAKRIKRGKHSFSPIPKPVPGLVSA